MPPARRYKGRAPPDRNEGFDASSGFYYEGHTRKGAYWYKYVDPIGHEVEVKVRAMEVDRLGKGVTFNLKRRASTGELEEDDD